MSVKRYEPQTIGAPNPATMVIDSNGHYIRFTDHLAEVARLEGEREKLREAMLERIGKIAKYDRDIVDGTLSPHDGDSTIVWVFLPDILKALTASEEQPTNNTKEH